MKLAAVDLVVAFILGSVISCSPPVSQKIPIGISGGMVASADSLATEAGLRILRTGGNAFDAAVAVGFALAVTHPQAGNLGGGGFAIIYLADSGVVRTLDFREKAPAAAFEDLYLDENGDVIEKLSTVGFLAAGVPGSVAGLLELLEKYGKLSRSQVLASAIKLATEGFIVDSALAEVFSEYDSMLSLFSATRKYFKPNGELIRAGELFVQTDLGNVLQRIDTLGSDGFYRGWVAQELAAQVQHNGGIISRSDLENYHPVWRKPIKFDFSRLTLYSMPPPSSGAIIMGEILGILDNFDLNGRKVSDPRMVHLFVEACKRAYADRAQYLGDPDFVFNPVDLLLSPDYLYARARSIDTLRATPATELHAGLGKSESENTTHFCVVDSTGNSVSLTYTLNSNFGCKHVVDGLGFFLNNEMDDFSIKPGVPNRYGLVGGKANAIAPDKRMLSSMSPTIVFYDDKPALVIGTSGGSKIITSVAAAVINLFGFGMELDSAINIPYYHHQWLPDLLYYEDGAFTDATMDSLTAWGHTLRQRSDYGDRQAILIYPDGTMVGVSDRRGNGYAAGF